MDDERSGEEEAGPASRPPTGDDLVSICRELNAQRAGSVVAGGLAMTQAGYPRTTGDIALIGATDAENETAVFKALKSLPDQCVKDRDRRDVAKFLVVRAADAIMVDLMASASGSDYGEAGKSIVTRELGGVCIPFASPELLWRRKRHTHREKDAPVIAPRRPAGATPTRSSPAACSRCRSRRG